MGLAVLSGYAVLALAAAARGAAPRRLSRPNNRRLEQFGTREGARHDNLAGPPGRPIRPPGGVASSNSPSRALVLALAPGVVLATAFYLTAPIAIQAGFPPIFAGVVGGAVILVGGELGWLLREAHRQTGA